jgi:hypothetical protein
MDIYGIAWDFSVNNGRFGYPQPYQQHIADIAAVPVLALEFPQGY